MYLASDACTTAGGLYTALARHFARVFVGLTHGWTAPDDPSVDVAALLADHIAEVREEAGYTVPRTMNEAFAIEVASRP